MKQNNENTNAFLMHISSFAGYLFPLGSIITPLILWQTQKERSYFLDKHGKEAVNFNISFALYLFILSAGIFSLFLNNIFDVFNGIDINFDTFNNWAFNSVFSFFGFASLVGIVSLFKIALIVLASIKANNGEDYEYPFTINFIK